MPNTQEIINVGFDLHQKGMLQEAEEAYAEALRMDDRNAEAYNLIGVLKLQKNEVDSAIKNIERAIEISPQAYFYETLFQAYIRNNDFDKILGKKDLVLKLFPDNFSLLFNIALACKNLKLNREGIKFYEKALNINPASYQAWFNLAHLYSVEAETKNAVSAMKACHKLKPNDDDTEYFLSLALMRTKDYSKGLKYFERRLCRETAFALQNKSYPNKVRKDNLWKGENIKNKTLLVYYEAGFGDTLMFARYLPVAAKKCKSLKMIISKPLSKLFKENKHLGISEIYDSFIPESDIEFDVHAPLMSLPYILGLKGKDVFAYSDGYLTVSPESVEHCRKIYFDNDNIKIGIKWQGNTYYDKDRVIPTEMFNSLLDIENTKWYSFQTFEGSEGTSKLNGVIDIGKDLINFHQTATALANLDLVICNDTSLAHLAGAMGVPCWVLLPYEVNWRWHTDLSVCDWYDSIRLFRQKENGDWNGIFKEVKDEMISILSKN